MDEKRTWIGALLSRRQVIPRWHSPQSALHAGERDSTKTTLKPHTLPVRWVPLLIEQAERDGAEHHAQVELEEMRFLLGHTMDTSMPATPTSPALLHVQQVWQQATEHNGTRPPPRPELTGDW